MSSDKGAHGSGGTSNYGYAFPTKSFESFDPSSKHALELISLSEEHGWVARTPDGPELSVGDTLVILPNHSCPIVNLADQLCAISQDGDTLSIDSEYWPVTCRGSAHGPLAWS